MASRGISFQPPPVAVPDDVPMFDFTVPVVNLQVVGTPTLAQAVMLATLFGFCLGWLVRRYHRQLIYSYYYVKGVLPNFALDVLEAIGLGLGCLLFVPLKAVFYFNDWWTGKVETLAREEHSRLYPCPPSPPLAPEAATAASGKKGK